jgi:hypothetical protein
VDGACLQSAESQQVLAILADCSSISLISASDSVNAPLLWSSEVLSKFRWAYCHSPTFEHHELQPEFVTFKDSKGVTGQGLDFILKSFSVRHRDILQIIAKDAFERTRSLSSTSAPSSSSSSSSSYGILFEDLLKLTKAALVVTSDPDLRPILLNLEEHRLISIVFDQDKDQYIHSNLLHGDLELIASKTHHLFNKK